LIPGLLPRLIVPTRATDAIWRGTTLVKNRVQPKQQDVLAFDVLTASAVGNFQLAPD
jgi:hypothetical protein